MLKTFDKEPAFNKKHSKKATNLISAKFISSPPNTQCPTFPRRTSLQVTFANGNRHVKEFLWRPKRIYSPVKEGNFSSRIL